VTEIDKLKFLSSLTNFLEIVVFPTPEGDDKTRIKPLREK